MERNQVSAPSRNFTKSVTSQHSWWVDLKCKPDSFKMCCDWQHNHGSQGTKTYFKSRFQWQNKYYLNSLWITWWQNLAIATNLQRKDTKIAPNCWSPWWIFVYRTIKNIWVMRRRPSVLLSRFFCHILRSIKKKKFYQTIKKSFLIWDAQSQSTANVSDVLSKHKIESVST